MPRRMRRDFSKIPSFVRSDENLGPLVEESVPQGVPITIDVAMQLSTKWGINLVLGDRKATNNGQYYVLATFTQPEFGRTISNRWALIRKDSNGRLFINLPIGEGGSDQSVYVE